jgi:hypothetical protein
MITCGSEGQRAAWASEACASGASGRSGDRRTTGRAYTGACEGRLQGIQSWVKVTAVSERHWAA